MKEILLILIVGLASWPFQAFASGPPLVISSPGKSVLISNVHVERSQRGFYVTGTVRHGFGFAPVASHVHISSYAVSGKLIGAHVEKIAASRLREWKLSSGRASFATFFPDESRSVFRVKIFAHSGRCQGASV